MIGPNRLEEITQKASVEFWKSVSKQLPDCKSENLSFGTITVLQWQMKAAIEQYIREDTEAKENSESKITKPENNEYRKPCKECKKQQFHLRTCSLDTIDGLILDKQRG